MTFIYLINLSSNLAISSFRYFESNNDQIFSDGINTKFHFIIPHYGIFLMNIFQKKLFFRQISVSGNKYTEMKTPFVNTILTLTNIKLDFHHYYALKTCFLEEWTVLQNSSFISWDAFLTLRAFPHSITTPIVKRHHSKLWFSSNSMKIL